MKPATPNCEGVGHPNDHASREGRRPNIDASDREGCCWHSASMPLHYLAHAHLCVPICVVVTWSVAASERSSAPVAL
eukprot:6492308-Amphidinium_carterae.3